ncbi:hypothetical protein QR680_005309 [Steinernema hermaphroditum]|uniref:Replication stress response regulator SDE2 n=1 Tax=Steinernema hermaphroditum TaxID=289476 RepID=A0AA39HSL4_9BILA|nr:hypothetical protein QR680_005309 [Steinernema hermaphroditum]
MANDQTCAIMKTEFPLSDKVAVDILRRSSREEYYVTHGGRVVQDWENLPEDAYIHVHYRLRGGKGGFGSLLRSFRIHKSTNQLMCRDLNGRRIADVKEEERLRKWIAKAAEREKRKATKKKEKYERLKAGPPKHEFNDPKYKEAHDSVDTRTEDALDAGLKALKKDLAVVKKNAQPEMQKAEATDSDSDLDGLDVPGPSWLIKKRKRKATNFVVPKKKPKLNTEKKEEGSQENNIPADGQPDVQKQPEVKSVKPEVATEAEKLDDHSIESLEALGFDQLKFELESRGLKCGGSLAERAKRLFSVMGLTPDKYPKSVKAVPKKK